MKKYIKPEIEIVLTDTVIMNTDSTGWRPGEEALAKPNTPMFDWDDNWDSGDYNLWGTDNEDI